MTMTTTATATSTPIIVYTPRCAARLQVTFIFIVHSIVVHSTAALQHCSSNANIPFATKNDYCTHEDDRPIVDRQTFPISSSRKRVCHNERQAEREREGEGDNDGYVEPINVRTSPFHPNRMTSNDDEWLGLATNQCKKDKTTQNSQSKWTMTTDRFT